MSQTTNSILSIDYLVGITDQSKTDCIRLSKPQEKVF